MLWINKGTYIHTSWDCFLLEWWVSWRKEKGGSRFCAQERASCGPLMKTTKLSMIGSWQWGFHLQKKLCATFISVYAPTLTNTEEVKEQFYSDLRDTIKRVPADDRLILIGDFNARIGSDSEKWKGVLGSQGVGKCNANGELLLALCSEYSLVITNTIFKHKEAHKNTCMHPSSKLALAGLHHF